VRVLSDLGLDQCGGVQAPLYQAVLCSWVTLCSWVCGADSKRRSLLHHSIPDSQQQTNTSLVNYLLRRTGIYYTAGPRLYYAPGVNLACLVGS